DARSVVARAVLDAVGAKSDWVDLTWEGEGQGWDLVNLWLCAKPESLPASESLLWFQVKGLPVFTSDGRNVGTIVDYEETGAHGIFGVRTPQGSDVLLPVAPSHVVVDIQAGRVTALQWDEMVAAAGADVPPDDEDTE
ncbi:MAG: PRC-barrel domain-containing protein, partial [Spirochaetia bacterium]|nr:PRC-barrel domain-containing protein [Spirochaetia bacterium]